MVKILIVDDQELIRESLVIMLKTRANFENCYAASSGVEALELVETNKPDVVLMDIRMNEMDGVECTRTIKLKYPDIKVIMLTTFNDDEYIYSALKYGASGYLLKGASIDELTTAINTVVKGGSIINPEVATKAIRLFSEMAKNENHFEDKSFEGEDLLSNNEWKIIKLVGQGLSNKEIAAKLFFTEGTVRNYLSILLDKLNLRDRTQLAIWAVSSGRVYKNVEED